MWVRTRCASGSGCVTPLEDVGQHQLMSNGPKVGVTDEADCVGRHHPRQLGQICVNDVGLDMDQESKLKTKSTERPLTIGSDLPSLTKNLAWAALAKRASAGIDTDLHKIDPDITGA
jgi:hypothetical protein